LSAAPMTHSMMVKLITGPSSLHLTRANSRSTHHPTPRPPPLDCPTLTHLAGASQSNSRTLCVQTVASLRTRAPKRHKKTCSELLPTHLAPSPCRLPTQRTSWREPGDPSSHAPLSGFAPQPMSAASASAPPPVPTSLERCCSARTSRCAAPARNPLPPPPCRRCAPPTPANTKSATLLPQHPATCEKKCSLRGHITKLD
jgi:hypothetical protein